MARLGLAIGGVALIGLGTAIGMGWWWPSTAEATGRVSHAVDAVKIANDSGDVTIRTGDVSRTSIRQHFSYQFGEPEHAYSYANGTLTLDGCGTWCSVDYEVTVPRPAAVTGSVDSGSLRLRGARSADVSADSGDVTVTGVDGAVTVDVDSGSVELRDIGGNTSVEADSGDVRVRGVRAPLRARVSSGDVSVRLAEPADVRASVSSGDLTVIAPGAETGYRVSGDTSSGNREIAVPRDSDSRYLLSLTSSSGDVTVHTPG